jgi:uncharacterized membrane protein
MKKILSTILLFLLFFVLFLPKYYAIDDTTKYDHINVNINPDGSITIKEYYALSGEYNGSYRDLNYIGSTKLFNGDQNSFEGSNIYNGSSIANIKVYDTIVTDNVITLNKQYTLVSSANKGQYGVYEQYNNNIGTQIKIYNPSYSNTGFYIEYTVNDVVIMHNDVAEIGWNFFGKNYEENTQDLVITFSLPEGNDSLRGWVHGPLNGSIDIVNNQTAIVKYDYLNSNTAIDVRLVFNKNIMTGATKHSNVNAMDKILTVEKGRADKANDMRRNARIMIYGVNILTYAWLLGLLILVIYTYKKYDKEHSSSFKNQYFRDFPKPYGPEIVDYLFNKRITSNAVSASLLEIIRKKHLKVEAINKKDYKLINSTDNKEQLTEAEQFLKDWFINDIGNGEEVTIKDIKSASSSYTKSKSFLGKYNEWQKLVTTEAEKENFFEDQLGIKIKLLLYTILGGILIFVLNTSLSTDNILGYLIFIPVVMASIYFGTFTRRTENGNNQYQEWKALKRFLNDFGRFEDKELPEVYLWEKYFVYATVFGIAVKLLKIMKLRLDKMAPELRPNYTFLYYNHMMMGNHFTSAINDSVHRSIINATANSKNASSSGFGGGASFGGGGFGGGGGGGRF